MKRPLSRPTELLSALACGTAVALALSGCSTGPSKKDQEQSDAMRAQLTELKSSMSQISTRLDGLESRMSAMDSKVDAAKASVDILAGNTRVPRVGLTHSPSDGAGTRVETAMAKGDPESGFVNDDSVQSYRKAMLFFDAKKYPEAVLGFSAFLDKYPDHPLAGSAQFFEGEAYFHENEYRLAVQEFKRVLTSYDRSSHVADTLRDLADCEDLLKLPEDAARHRQLLTSLFPQSPAAAMSPAAASAGADQVKKSPSSEAHQAAPAGGASALDAPPMPGTGPGTAPAAAKPQANAQQAPGLDSPPAAPPTAPIQSSAGSGAGNAKPEKAE